MNKQYTVPTGNTPGSGGGGGGSGTVTSVSMTGDGTVLNSVVPGSPVTTSGTLAPTLANAGGGTVLGNNTTSSAAPAYTTAPVLGIPGTSTGSIALASSTASGKYTITAPANAATPTLTLPTGTGTFAVTASAPIVLNATTGALTAPTAVTSAASLTSNAVVLGGGGQATSTQTFLTTDGAAKLTVGVIGGGNGVLALAGNTSGTATFTAPAVAGTSNNPVAVSNILTGPDGGLTTPTYGFTNSTSIGMSQSGGSMNLNSASNINLASGGSILWQFQGGGDFLFNKGKGAHIRTQAANNDMAGTLTSGSGTTVSATFTTNYTSTPAIVITPTTAGITSAIITSQSNSGFTITYAPSGAATFNYLVIGNPN